MSDNAIAAAADTAKSLDIFGANTRLMSPTLAIMLDQRMFDRCRQIATYLSKAEGFVPKHLVGKAESCFAVVSRSITWKLDPYAVAMCTWQTPDGKVGFEGKLCQAILENSGKITGGVRFEHYGDWDKVKGKWKIGTSRGGKDYPVPTWTREDAKGLGVRVIAQVVGEVEPRTWPFDLDQAYPLNSTLWATDPKSQICYAAVRRFASLAAPGLFMGVPFDPGDFAPGDTARDVTPPETKDAPAAPKREDFKEKSPPIVDVQTEGEGDKSAGSAASDETEETGTSNDHQDQGGSQEEDDALAGFDLVNAVGEVVRSFGSDESGIYGMDLAELMMEAARAGDPKAVGQISSNNSDGYNAVPALPDGTNPIQEAIVASYNEAMTLANATRAKLDADAKAAAENKAKMKAKRSSIPDTKPTTLV